MKNEECPQNLEVKINTRKRFLTRSSKSSSSSIESLCNDKKESRSNFVFRSPSNQQKEEISRLITISPAQHFQHTELSHKLVIPRRNRKRKIIVAGLILSGIVIVIIAAIILQSGEADVSDTKDLVPPNPEDFLPPSWSKLRIFKGGAVCSDGVPCAAIGKEILDKNGSAVDATIAAMICNGLVNMQSMGLGGGFQMTIYDRQSQKSYFLVARDMAPLAAHADMYKNASSDASRKGPLAISVPGEVAGYAAAHERFGKLKWEELFVPSIRLCESGWNMTRVQYDDLFENADGIHSDPTLRQMFVDPSTKDFRKPGSLIRPQKLCETLKILQSKGASEFYNGTLGQMMIEDLKKKGSILVMEDLRRYRPVWKSPLQINLSDGTRVYTPNLPSSGALLSFVLNVLDEFKFTPNSLVGWNNTILTYHRIIETWKFAYAMRSKMGDDLFVDMSEFVKNLTSRDYARAAKAKISDERTWNDPAHYGAGESLHEDHGTAQISVLSPSGDAVSVTSSINMYFGSGIVSERTGILLNSGMDDFSIPAITSYFGLPGTNKNNLIEPQKRPLSSMVPSILVAPSGDVRMVIGSSGGTKITTSVSFAIARHLWMNNTIKQALDAARIHHQVFPMRVDYEYGVPEPIVEGLQRLGHKTFRYRERGSVVCGLTQVNGTVFANADYRKGGDVYGTNEKYLPRL